MIDGSKYTIISSSEQELKDSMMNELNTVYKSGSRKWNTSSLGMEIHVLSMLRAKRRIMHVWRTDSEIEKKGANLAHVDQYRQRDWDKWKTNKTFAQYVLDCRFNKNMKILFCIICTVL